jgi:hypothetical protein
MPDWAPKAPIQFSDYGCFNHRAPELSSGRSDQDGPMDALETFNVVDAAPLSRERLASGGS